MSVKGSLVSQESSASTALAPMAVARAPKACWEMGQHVQVSREHSEYLRCIVWRVS